VKPDPFKPRRGPVLAGLVLLVAFLLLLFGVLFLPMPPDSSVLKNPGTKALVASPVFGVNSEIAISPKVIPPAATQIDSDFGKKTPVRQLVARLVFDKGMCSLHAFEEVQGDFRPRRGDPPLHDGMIVSRLLSSTSEVLAQEFTHPPDCPCTVLDRNLPNGPKAAVYAGIGPQMFQARLPHDPRAVLLTVSRITQTPSGPAEKLLLSQKIQP
jgi:hypothetical protein